jgi:molybdopterin-guanine dinucleotide biosynthesis protein MobB
MLAISGWSGAGKTTLLEALIPRLAGRGLRVGVLKRDAHRLEFDRPGKDTMRLREAGAVRVEAFDQRWWFQVAPVAAVALGDVPARAFRQDVDLVVVEGGKGGGLDKIWLHGPDGKDPPRGMRNVILAVSRDPGRVEAVEERLLDWLDARWRAQPSAEQALDLARGFADRVLDAAPPVPGAAGAPGELLAALRWAPEHTWIALDSSRPCPRSGHLEWLWSRRRPGIWAVVPALDGRPDPLGAVYEPQAGHLLEDAAPRGPEELSRILGEHPCVEVLEPPVEGAR